MTTFTEYCPECDEDTEHRETTDEILGHAVQCLNCGIVWEAETELDAFTEDSGVS